MIKAVLFDYGETLVRPRSPWSEMRLKAIRNTFLVMKRNGLEMGYDEYTEKESSIFSRYRKMENETNRDIHDIVKFREVATELFPGQAARWQRRVADSANTAFWKVVNHNYVLNNNARRSLARLARMGVRMSVISNHHNPEALSGHLDQLGISRYFDHVYVSAQLGIRKPDSRIFKMCLSAMKVNPSETMFVGDSMENDVEGAKGAGIRAILMAGTLNDGLRGTGIGPDFVIRDLGEVPAIISSLAKDSSKSTHTDTPKSRGRIKSPL